MVSTGIRYDGAMSDWGQKLTWTECPLLAQSGHSLHPSNLLVPKANIKGRTCKDHDAQPAVWSAFSSIRLSPCRRLIGSPASNCVRPAFRESQCRRREWATLTFPRPGSPISLDAVADETCAERGDQYGAHALAPVRKLVRLRVDE
jgi:hypothetical protein